MIALSISSFALVSLADKVPCLFHTRFCLRDSTHQSQIILQDWDQPGESVDSSLSQTRQALVINSVQSFSKGLSLAFVGELSYDYSEVYNTAQLLQKASHKRGVAKVTVSFCCQKIDPS